MLFLLAFVAILALIPAAVRGLGYLLMGIFIIYLIGSIGGH